VPEATTLKVTLLPAVTVWLTGCVVMAGAIAPPLPAGAKTATETASWLLLPAVQLTDVVPVVAGAAVEPAPPELVR